MTAVDHDVIVIGAGPAGLLLAAELTRRGIDTELLERRTESRYEGEAGSRAVGVHPPVLAALESSGATERILDEGARIPRGIARAKGRTIGEVRLDRLPIRFPFAVSVPQAITEAAVAAGGPIPRRGVCAVSLAERSDHVAVAVRRGSVRAELRARAVVVAAGASGRDLMEPFIPQRGRAYRDRYLMADLLSAPGQPRDTAIITLHPAGVVESFPSRAGAAGWWPGSVQAPRGVPARAPTRRRPSCAAPSPTAPGRSASRRASSSPPPSASVARCCGACGAGASSRSATPPTR